MPDETFLDANELVINMGPQHPATHGVLRVILKLDGEKVAGSECVIGYLHRGVEKIGENRTCSVCPFGQDSQGNGRDSGHGVLNH